MQQVNWKRNLVILWLGQFISMVAFNSSYTFIPFYLIHIGVDNPAERSWYIAMCAAMGNIGFALFAPMWGILSDRHGRKMMLLRANFSLALLIPLMALITSPGLLVAHRFLAGALSGTVTATQTLVLNTTPAKNRSFALGAIASSLFGGMLVGTLVGGFAVKYLGFLGTFVICGAMLLVAGLLILFGVEEHFDPVNEAMVKKKEKKPFKISYKPVFWLMVLFTVLSIAREFDTPFVPELVILVHGPYNAEVWSGIIGGVCATAGIASGLMMGALADRLPLYKIAMVAIFFAGLFRIPQGMATGIGTVLLFRGLSIFSLAGIEPLFQSWLAGVTEESQHGAYFGWAASFKAVGWASGALLGGWCAVAFNDVRMVFYFAGFILIAMLPLVYFVDRVIPPVHIPKRAKR